MNAFYLHKIASTGEIGEMKLPYWELQMTARVHQQGHCDWSDGDS